MIQLPSNISNYWFVCIFSVLLFVQVILFFRYIYWYLKSRVWKEVDGVVLFVSLKKGSLANETNDSLVIKYSYKIDSTEFVNDKVALTDYACSWLVSPSRNLVKKMSLRSKPGSIIKVFVSEVEPSKSAVDINLDLRVLLLSPIFFCFLLIMLLESLGIYKLI